MQTKGYQWVAPCGHNVSIEGYKICLKCDFINGGSCCEVFSLSCFCPIRTFFDDISLLQFYHL